MSGRVALACLRFGQSEGKRWLVRRVTTTTVCKPGYGYGDTNHCHTGPPGQNK